MSSALAKLIDLLPPVPEDYYIRKMHTGPIFPTQVHKHCSSVVLRVLALYWPFKQDAEG